MALKSVSQRGKKSDKAAQAQVKKDNPAETIHEVIQRIKADLAKLEKLLGD